MKTKLFLAAAALTLAAPAFAQPQGRSNPDANGDGNVTRAEMEADVAAKFAKMDLNRDGQVTQPERDQLRAQRMEMMKQRMAEKGRTFDEEKMKARMEKRQDRMANRGDRAESRGRHGPDANSDGVITLAEMQSAATQRFDRMDADKDGVISKAERDAMQAKRGEMRAKWQERREATGG